MPLSEDALIGILSGVGQLREQVGEGVRGGLEDRRAADARLLEQQQEIAQEQREMTYEQYLESKRHRQAEEAGLEPSRVTPQGMFFERPDEPSHARSELELFQRDPESYQKYLNIKREHERAIEKAPDSSLEATRRVNQIRDAQRGAKQVMDDIAGKYEGGFGELRDMLMQSAAGGKIELSPVHRKDYREYVDAAKSVRAHQAVLDEIIQQYGDEPEATDGIRQAAIDALKEVGAPVIEANIKAAIQQLR